MNNSIQGYQGFSSQLRFTGLSGLDTESIISKLMMAERIPLDSLKQKRTLIEWKQEAYREISSSLIGFKSRFFDIVNRSSYMLSKNAVIPMSTETSNSSYVTATASADAKPGVYKVKVEQLATSATVQSKSGISRKISGTVDTNELGNLEGKKMVVTLDGVTRMITLKNTDEANLADMIQQELDNAFGLVASGNSKFKVTYETVNVEGTEIKRLTIDTAEGVTKLVIGGPMDDSSALPALGIDNGATNRISLKSTLEFISLGNPLDFNETGKIAFTINGKTFEFDKNDTLQSVFDRINNDDTINVSISYDEITDEITIKSKQTGAGSTLELDDKGSNFFAALNINTDEITEGQDAVFSINDQKLIRGSNTVSINGVTYTLHKVHENGEEDTITVTQDIDTAVENIKTFIEEYNKLIENINGKIKESYDSNYPPLTDAQKAEMKEDEIKKWEEKAKTGLLRNDSLLQNLTLAMRRALYENVEGVSITLADIGISSRSYTDNGKLYLDETKLREQLAKRPEEVTKLLNGVSEQVPSYDRDLTQGQRTIRYNNSGVLVRVSDIIEDYISTKRNKDGNKGLLLQKAGIESDSSVTQNLLYDQLEDYDKRINSMMEKLIKKENQYYMQFSRLETILTQMNQQSMWIMSQFMGG